MVRSEDFSPSYCGLKSSLRTLFLVISRLDFGIQVTKTFLQE
jgi:hypothetical protein